MEIGENDQHSTAILAVDGNIDQRASGNSCARTAFKPVVWWRVDLQAIHNIYSIKVFYRNDSDQYVYENSPENERFSVIKKEMKSVRDPMTTSGFRTPDVVMIADANGDKLPPLLSEHVCRKHGRYITYYNERGNGVVVPQGSRPTTTIADLCEVQVLGCSKNNVYGKNCDKQCPDNCLERNCHIETGYCQECIKGRQGQRCEKCNDGFFGLNCTTRCSEFCNNVTCESTTGECFLGCAPGYIGLQCNKMCTGGKYGNNCSNDCGHCVRGKLCDHVSGFCEGGCAEGYKGQICKTPCSHGEYGKNCLERCSSNCLNGEICNPFYGGCISCTPGWKGLLCKEGKL
ncbi:multiple epidermal growth factor-like domains protein 10 [Saccostrea echinata]|uniref:multiple epidermal growth factor-like domains protein 10 n=1 Tax=Saccostrea echinata TaxID=191078 RepID=UPI002A801977|nr:multiple epidermal growth factor-like domains protein 10 [Saccostrea echinata]